MGTGGYSTLVIYFLSLFADLLFWYCELRLVVCFLMFGLGLPVYYSATGALLIGYIIVLFDLDSWTAAAFRFLLVSLITLTIGFIISTAWLTNRCQEACVYCLLLPFTRSRKHFIIC